MAGLPEINAQLIPWFLTVQKWMEKAQSEGAQGTYEMMKEKYYELKGVLQANGLNLVELDRLKL